MNEQLQQRVREIKQSFRQLMDGMTAQSMRDKGVEYKLNWGASIPMLRDMEDIGNDGDACRQDAT